jgi:hypothetical protein
MTSQAPCVRCGATPTEQYSFHYGRMSRPSDTSRWAQGTTVVTHVTHHYEIGGVGAAAECARCVALARRRSAARILGREIADLPLLWFLIFVALAIVVGKAAAGDWPVALAALAALIGISVAAYAFVLLFRPAQSVGEEMAIEDRKADLQREGWPEFWTTKEFAKLKATGPAGSTRPI